MNLSQYNKAIAAAITGLIAVIYAIVTGADAEEVSAIEAAILPTIQGVVTAVLVYVIPNLSGSRLLMLVLLAGLATPALAQAPLEPGTGMMRVGDQVYTIPVAAKAGRQVASAGSFDIRLGAGTYEVTISNGKGVLTIDAAGNESLRMTQATVFIGGTVDDDPTLPPAGNLAEVVRRETAAIANYRGKGDHVTGLSLLYEALGTGMQTGQLAPAAAQQRLAQLRPQLLGADAAKWQQWSSAVDPMTRTAAEYLEVARALSGERADAFGDGRLLDRLIDLIVSGEATKIIEFILQLIELFGDN